MIKIKQINDQFVNPVRYQFGGDDKREIKGKDLFDEIYCNIYCVAKKKSGKTTVLNKIVRECCTTETTVMVFCSTVNKDKSHLALKAYCKSKHIPYLGYTSMVEDGVNVLETLMKQLEEEAQQEEPDSESEEEETKNSMVLFDSSDSEDEEAPKKRKNKYRACDYFIVIDDLSNELKNPILVAMLQKNRHYHFKLVISTQYS